MYQIKLCNSNRLIRQIMAMVKRDRDGDVVPHEAAKKAIDSFGIWLTSTFRCVCRLFHVCHSTHMNFLSSLVYLARDTEFPLSLYVDEFEKVYLAETREYYEAESSRVVSSDMISAHMLQVGSQLVPAISQRCDPDTEDIGQATTTRGSG